MLNHSPSTVPFCLCILGLLLFFFAFTHFTVNLSLMLLKLLWFALLKILQLEGIFFFALAGTAKSITFSYFVFLSNDSLDKHLCNCLQEAISPLSANASQKSVAESFAG